MSEGWATHNPCDHEIVTPYFVGHLAMAAVECAAHCPMTTYQDNAQVCHACPIVGCETCAGAEGGCQACLIFHMRTSSEPDAQCLFLYGAFFAAVVLFSLCFLLLGLLRFCCLGLTTARAPGVLREALAHRRRAKVHDYGLPGNPFYSYDDTNVRRTSISGIGPMLYFRFVAFLVLLCFISTLLLLLGLILPQLTAGEDGLVPLPKAFAKKDLGLAFKLHAVVLYVVSLAITLNWMAQQDRAVKTDTEEEPHLRNYALVAEGFPKSARSPHEVKAYFESILGFEVEGVSIAYDHAEELAFVQDRISRVIEKADTHLGVYPSELSGLESHVGDSQDGYVLDCLMCSGYAFVVFSREEDREFCMRRFAEIERQVRSGAVGDVEAAGDEDNDETQSLLLKTGPGKGRASRPSTGGPSRAVLFRGRFPIRVGHAPEPCGIQWEHFVVQGRMKAVRVGLTLLGTLLLVLVVAAVLFAPAVLYEMSFGDVAKPTVEQYWIANVERGVVATSAAIANRLLIAAFRRAATSSGFLQKVNEDSVLFVCAYFVCVVNSVVPLAIADLVATTDKVTVSNSLSVSWLFQVLATCIAATELAGCFVPMWRYWNSYFWLRQSRYVSVREGEPVLTASEFPLATRYVDLMHCLTLVFGMIAIDATSPYTVCAQTLLLFYSMYVYFFDKYAFLRINRQTHYASPKLNSVVHFFFVFPLSVLFISPLQHLGLSPLPWASVGAFFGNAALVMALARVSQKCNEPHRELSDIPYVEVASLMPYNYFNTNPVHVLRTLHFPSIVVPPLYPLVPGKEYLHGGQFADYDDSVRLRETLMLLAKTPLKGFDVGMGANPQD